MCYSIIGDNMEDKFYKYACLLLDKGLNISKGQPLVITAPIESIEFIRVLSKCCLDRGVTDIYYDFFDDELKHQQLLYLSNDEISNSLFFNKKVYDLYSKKDGAFLMLVGEDPDITREDYISAKAINEIADSEPFSNYEILPGIHPKHNALWDAMVCEACFKKIMNNFSYFDR